MHTLDQQPSDPTAAARRAASHAYFGGTSEGLIYRAPNPYLFGRAKHYLVTAAEREQILDVLAASGNSRVGRLVRGLALAIVLFAILSLATSAVVLFATHFAWATNATLVMLCLLVTLLIAVVVVASRLARLQLSRLQPILANARPTQARITNAEVLAALRAAASPRARRWQGIASAAAGVVMGAAFCGAAYLAWPTYGGGYAYVQPLFLSIVALLSFVRAPLAILAMVRPAALNQLVTERRINRLVLGAAAVFLVITMGHLALRLSGVLAPDFAGMRMRAEIAAGMGNAEAMRRLGWFYWQGKGVTRDLATAHAWYEKGAAAGDGDSMVALGVFAQGGLITARDYGEARAWFAKAAAAGNGSAMDWIGWNYQNGLGVAKDLAAARQWFEKAAAAEYSLGQHHLAVLYMNGWGVAPDYDLARQWFLKAASKGLGASMDKLGVMSISGFGGPKDQQAARDWYEQAARKGDLEGMQHLAAMLDQGSGGPADRTRAAHLLLETAKRGHIWSRTVLNGPLTFLTPQTRAALKDELGSLGFYTGEHNSEWDDAARAAYQAYLTAPSRSASPLGSWT